MPAAISIENLSKRYIVDHEAKQRGGYRTLRESLVDAASYPLRRLRGQTGATHEEFWALKDVSFEVQPGEVVGIIGRNGAGKSTLLKILSQITKPTTGRVTLNGRVGSLLEVGTGFHPELTGRENIYLNGSILGMSRREIDRKFDEIVDFAEIEKFLDTPVKRYSSGMYVRLAFAVAAHLEPEILIVDEVLAVGDAGFQKKCLQQLSRAATSGRTVVFVSHQISALQRLCKNAVFLKQGHVAFQGSVDATIPLYLEDVRTAKSGQRVSITSNARNRFTALKLRTDVPTEPIRPDRPLSVDVEIEAAERHTDVRLAVSLYDRFGTKLLNADSIALGKPLCLELGINTFSIDIEAVHLKPGSYCIGLWLANSRDILDSCDTAAFIDIIEEANRHVGYLGGGDGYVTCDFTVSC